MVSSKFSCHFIFQSKGTGRITAPHTMSRVLMNQNLSTLFHCWECSFIHHLGSSTSLFISSMYFSINFCTYFCAFFPFLLGCCSVRHCAFGSCLRSSSISSCSASVMNSYGLLFTYTSKNSQTLQGQTNKLGKVIMEWPIGRKGCHHRAWSRPFARLMIDG